LALKRRRFTREFKLQVVRELEAGKTPAQAAREYHIHPTLIVRWRQEHLRDAERAFTGNGHPYVEMMQGTRVRRRPFFLPLSTLDKSGYHESVRRVAVWYNAGKAAI
jgi:transposase-like protein